MLNKENGEKHTVPILGIFYYRWKEKNDDCGKDDRKAKNVKDKKSFSIKNADNYIIFYKVYMSNNSGVIYAIITILRYIPAFTEFRIYEQSFH